MMIKLTALALSCAMLLFGCASSGSVSSASSTSAVPPSSASTSASDADRSTVSDPASTPAKPVRIAGLKGPTSMGMVQLYQKAGYEMQVHGTADEILARLLQGELDAAALPANVASILYQKGEHAFQVAAINTLGVLYLVEQGKTIQSFADLKGKRIYSPGAGTTPEYTLRYLLAQNGLSTDSVQLEFKSEAAEVAALAATSTEFVAVLPQPFVTAAMQKNSNLRIALDLTEEWEAVSDGKSSLVTGVLVVSKQFVENQPEQLTTLLADYKASTLAVNSDPSWAAQRIAQLDIVPAAVAEKAIPFCSIVWIEGTEMQQRLSGYLQILFDQNPKAVGGAVPDAAFYLLQ